MNKRMRLALLPFAVSSMLAMGAAMAQNVTSAAITGRVLNATGQPVAGATVHILHEPSGTTKIVTTDANGRYSAQGMRVGGPYDVTATKAGTPEGERNDVYLQLGQVSSINLSAQSAASIANAQKLGTVTVSANAISQTFSPENKGISTNISQRELEAMPTPGRSIQDIARMDPRVVVTDRAEGKISAVGQNYRYNNITVDSVGANDPFGLNANGLPTAGTPISQDTIAEYNISTASYDVANRRGLGANINAVTKSGTNNFHGSVYYVFQNPDMIGETADHNKYAGFDRKWTGGGTIGGPIIKDKLFFFASYEKSEQVGGGGGAYGPEGSGMSDIVRGLSTADVQAVRDAAAKYGLTDLGSYTGGNSNLIDKRSLAKLDWNISDNHRASFTYQRTKESQPATYGGDDKLVLSSGWVAKNTDSTSYALHLYDDWTDNFSSVLSLSYAHYNRTGGPLTGGDMTDITVHTDNYKSPSVEFGTNYSYMANAIDTKTWYGSWAGTWYLGDHTIKGGVDYERDKKYNVYLADYFGSYTFDSIDDFKSGKYSSYYYNRPADGLSLADTAAAFTLAQYGVFLQDTWQVTNNLSLQYGGRIDIPKTSDKPIYNEDFANAGFTTSTGKTLTTNQYNVDNKKVFQPRLSFNYNFDTARRLQVRGGAGLFITNPPAVWVGNIYANAGKNVTGFNCTPRYGCAPPPFSTDPHNQNDGEPGSGQMTVNTVDPDFELPSAYKFSLGLDAELPFGLVGTADYQHIKPKNAIWYQDLNLGDPTGALPDGRVTYYKVPDGDPHAKGQNNRANANQAFSGAIINLASTSKGKADSLTLALKKPFKDNWSAMVGFTLSHATDVNPGLSSVANSSYKQSYVTNSNENVASISNYNIPRRFIASATWRHAYFGDYYTSFSAFFDGHDGHPYSWDFGNDANGDSFTNDLAFIPKPGQVEFKDGTDPQLISQFYDYIQHNGYLKGHQGQIAQRNAQRAPWFNQLDISISQQVPGIFKGNKGELRLDIHNFTNLLNRRWGIEKRASFPGYRELADFYGVDPATGKYIYDITGSDYNDGGQYKPRSIPVYNDSYGTGDLAQRWSVQLTLRYTF